MCTVNKLFAGLGSLTCNNAGANTHAGLHTSSVNARGGVRTVSWGQPGTGTITEANSDSSPGWFKPIQVGVLDTA